MFFPIGDTPHPRNFTAWVNWCLLAANVLVFLLVTVPLSAQPVNVGDPALHEYLRVLSHDLPHGVPLRALLNDLSAYDLYVFEHGYKPAAPEVSDLFYSLFLHGGLAHLAGNMLFLWIFGRNVEHRLGRGTYLVTYLATGALATLSYALLAHGSPEPLVGASGAISGVLGVYFLVFPRNKVKVFVFLFPFLMDVILLPARLVLGLYLLVDNLLPVILGAQTGVAYGAHLGGFVSGLLLAGLGEVFHWRLPGRARARVGGDGTAALEWDADALAEVESTGGLGEHTRVEQLVAAIERRDRERALRLVSHVGPELYTLDLSLLATLAEWLMQEGFAEEAESLLHRALAQQRRVDSQRLAQVHLVLGLIQLRAGQTAAAYQLLQRASALGPDPETAARIERAMEGVPLYRRMPRLDRL